MLGVRDFTINSSSRNPCPDATIVFLRLPDRYLIAFRLQRSRGEILHELFGEILLQLDADVGDEISKRALGIAAGRDPVTRRVGRGAEHDAVLLDVDQDA